MTEPSLPDIRTQRPDEWHTDGSQGRPRYLPSPQVLTELAVLGPDLRRVADDLRIRLTETETQPRR